MHLPEVGFSECFKEVVQCLLGCAAGATDLDRRKFDAFDTARCPAIERGHMKVARHPRKSVGNRKRKEMVCIAGGSGANRKVVGV